MIRNVFLMFAFLCAVAQGAWAQMPTADSEEAQKNLVANGKGAILTGDIQDEWEWAPDCSDAYVTLRSEAFENDKHFSTKTKECVTITSEKRGGYLVYIATLVYEANGYEYEFTSEHEVPQRVTLYDDADNSRTLEQYNEQFVGLVIVQGRPLYLDGSWNTICLPFEISADKTEYLENPKALKRLVSSDFDRKTGKLTLNFEDANYIEAGRPYLIKWDNINSVPVYNPGCEGVTIYNEVKNNSTEYVDFVGSFSPVELEGNDKTVLYMGSDNKLYYPSVSVTMGACRAVFRLKGISAAGLKEGAKNIVLNFGDDTPTSLSEELRMNSEESATSDVWHTLDGRRVNGKPTAKGLYIYKGKKLVVK